jgi:hypothetical protein
MKSQRTGIDRTNIEGTKFKRWFAALPLLAAGTLFCAQPSHAQAQKTIETPHGLSRSKGKALQTLVDSQATDDVNKIMSDADLLAKSRQAGLLTDWHIEGRFGHRGPEQFAKAFAPEKAAEKQAARRFQRRRYELVFPEGTFGLPRELAGLDGVFYALSNTYLTSGGEWYLYLESGAETAVFVDGRRALTRGHKAAGVLRAKIHLESGYHSVMVKFTSQAAPFRIAILPPNSGSKRKNNTPYLQAAPASEDMLARQGDGLPAAGSL